MNKWTLSESLWSFLKVKYMSLVYWWCSIWFVLNNTCWLPSKDVAISQINEVDRPNEIFTKVFSICMASDSSSSTFQPKARTTQWQTWDRFHSFVVWVRRLRSERLRSLHKVTQHNSRCIELFLSLLKHSVGYILLDWTNYFIWYFFKTALSEIINNVWVSFMYLE